MHDLGKIAYLDMNKTGSTMCSMFLNKCCSLETVEKTKHSFLKEGYDPDVFYFTTVRDPFALYISLFRYGCDARGTVYNRINKMDKADLFYGVDNEKFNRWVAFMLEPENIGEIYKIYKPLAKLDVGLMTLRHLTYCLEAPMRNLRACKTMQEVEAVIEKQGILDLVLKNEELADGLKDIALNRLPQYFDAAEVVKFFDKDPRINTSQAGSKFTFEFSDENRAKILEKENYLIKNFYPEAMGA